MRAQALTGYGKPLEYVARIPAPPRGLEVLLQVSHCGLCHSDLHLIDGFLESGGGERLDMRGKQQLPHILGHEICGVIADAGTGVASSCRQHDLFAVYPWIGCGSCARCEKGEDQLCRDTRYLGIDCDGGFASHVLVPHPRYLIDATGLDARLAGSLMCGGLTAFSALKKALATGCDGSLLIIGLGGVGLMALLLSAATTSLRVVVGDIDASKRQTALAYGAAGAIDPTLPDAQRMLRSQFGTVAAVIDFVGSEQSVAFALSSLGKGGTVVMVGLMGGRLSLPIPMLPLRQWSLAGSFVGSLPEARDLVDLARTGRLNQFPVAVRPLDGINAAIDELRAGKVIGRIALEP